MKIIERYIALHTLWGVLVVLSLFATVFSLMELLIQINDVGKGNYQLPDAFIFVAATLPKRIVDLLPICILLGGIIALIKAGDISGKIAKDLFEIVYTEGGDPAEIVEARGMKQVTDTGAIEAAVDEIIAANPAQVEKAQQNPKLAGWFVGQVMKATGGKANPKAVNEIVSAKLGL